MSTAPNDFPDDLNGSQQVDRTYDPREFHYLRAGTLVIDERKQREIDAEKATKIAHEWDWSRVEALTVCPRANEPGMYDVIEGQHRRAAGVIVGGPEMMLPCMVLPATTSFKTQSQIALDIVQGRRGHSAYERWRLRYNAGHPHEVFATTVLDSHGVRLGKSTSTMTIAAVAAVVTIVHGGHHTPEYGADVLDRTITVVKTAYPTYDHESQTSRWDRFMLLAVSGVIIRWPDVDQDRLIRSLRVRPAVQWVASGKQAGPSPHIAIMGSITAEYNRHIRKNRLA